MKKSSMLWKVMLAIILGIGAGSLTGKTASIFGVTCYELYEVASQLFLNSLTLLVIPLIAAAIISGLGQMNGEKSFGKLGGKTFGFYILTISIAVLIGVLMVNIIKPGLIYKGSAELTSLHEGLAAASAPISKMQTIYALLYKLIPGNIIEAASQGNMIGIIFFSILFGFAMMKLEMPFAQTLIHFWKGLFQVLMRVTQFMMKMLPFGVFCLMAKVVASQGLQSMGGLVYFFITVVLGLSIFCFVIMPLFLKIIGVDPIKHMKAVAPALITAFSTSSSAATLPITMECVEKRAGVSNRVCSFVVPLGLSMNMAGSALYECVAALFIAQVYGIHLTVGHQILIAALSLITSLGVAGVPSGSLVGIMIILHSLGLPAEGIALILPLDRILDMCRTTANVFSDATCAVLIAHTEGEKVLTSDLQRAKEAT